MRPYYAAELPVLVGVDGSRSATGAVGVAAAEALRRRCRLTVLHAVHDTSPAGEDEGRAVLRDAAVAARAAGLTDAELETLLVAGDPARVLCQHADKAAMVVVAHRGTSMLEDLIIGSTAAKVSADSPAPVLLVRGTEHAVGPIVVGVDGDPASRPVIETAFYEAEIRGTDCTAVHTWTGPVSSGPGDMLPLVYDVAEVKGEEQAVLGEALAGMREAYPDVTVQEMLIKGPAARTLERLSHTAQLIVIGTRARRSSANLVPGKVRRHLLHHSACPVLVVPREGT
ncbi:universal stress protein [Catellatospora chokoriensis]|nr:universal stress protein [Catellatospora chokoriensis]